MGGSAVPAPARIVGMCTNRSSAPALRHRRAHPRGRRRLGASHRRAVCVRTGIQLELNTMSMEVFNTVETAAARCWRRHHHGRSSAMHL
eukprot:3200268-Prymnesium_polylepis.1